MRRPTGPAGWLVLGILLAGCRPAPDRPGFSYPFDYFYVEPHEPRFVPRSDPILGEVYMERRPMSRAQSFPLEKGPRAFRAFIIGGSVAQAYDEQRGSGPSLADALAGLFPGRGIEVVNLGRAGYDSGRDALAMEEALSYSPDLIVVMDGVNESQPSLPSRREALLARWLRGVPLLSGAWQERVVSRALERTPKDAAGLDRRFESNIRRMARRARERRVPMVLCALPGNLRDMPPRGELPLRQPSFLRAWIAWEKGEAGRAQTLLREFLKEHPDDPMGLYFLGRSLDRAGSFSAARDCYLRAEASGNRFRAFNEISRRVAREEGVLLADLEEAFSAVSPQGLPGRGLFEDDVHWHRFADPLVTLVIARSLAGSDARWVKDRSAAIAEAVRRARVSRDQAWFVFRYRMWSPVYWRESPGLSERVIALLETIREAHPGLLSQLEGFRGWLRDRLRDNVWDRDAARTFERWWPMLMGHVGELYRRAGEHGLAQKYFRAALEGGDAAAALRSLRFGLALSLLQSGRSEEARAERLRLPEDAAVEQVWKAYCEAWPGPGRPAGPRTPPAGPDLESLRQEADRVLAAGSPGTESERRSPRLVAQALAAYGRGDVAGAFRGLDAALKEAPADTDALMSRGTLRGLRKDWAAALADYDAVLLSLRAGGGAGDRDASQRMLLWADAVSARAVALEGLGRAGEAERAYAEALEHAPGSWPRRAEAEAGLRRCRAGGAAPAER